MDDKDFLFTWKADKWPYEKLKALVDRFKAGEAVIEPWRCQAHRLVRQGARAYVYKQGPPPRGIFAVADIIGEASETKSVDEERQGRGRPVFCATSLHGAARSDEGLSRDRGAVAGAGR